MELFQTFETNRRSIKAKDEKNVIYGLLNNDRDPYYSIASVSDVKMTRMESSDMVKLEFESNDPGICQNVLNITTEVIIRKFRGIKQGETNDVSSFFELKCCFLLFTFKKKNVCMQHI